MGIAVQPGQEFVKGAACKCLDKLHLYPAQLSALAGAIQAARPAYGNFEVILRDHLLNLLYDANSKPSLDDIVSHLKKRWFGAGTLSMPAYFGASVSQQYAEGLAKALSYSQSVQPPAPIDAYWSLGHDAFNMIVVTDKPITKVTLIIATPTPATFLYP